MVGKTSLDASWNDSLKRMLSDGFPPDKLPLYMGDTSGRLDLRFRKREKPILEITMSPENKGQFLVKFVSNDTSIEAEFVLVTRSNLVKYLYYR